MKLTSKEQKWIYVLGVIGLILSVYLTFLHYNAGGHDAFCEGIGGGCDIASGSLYSSVDGILNMFGIYVDLPIPVSILGIIAMLLIISFVYVNDKKYNGWLFYVTLLFVLFSAYLTYGEFIVLDTFCIYCDLYKLDLLGIFGILCWKKFR